MPLVEKLYSEERPATSRELAQLRSKHPIRSRLRPKKYRSGFAYADDDGNYNAYEGNSVFGDSQAVRRVKHFSSGVYPPKGVEKRIAGRTNRGAANVGKRLVEETSRTSATHAAMAGSGAAAIAWGGSRSHALGRGLRSGAVNPQIDPGVQRALVAAERARRMIETTTEPLGRVTGRGVGRMPTALRHALEDVPRPLRPATATLAGAILIQHARPVRRKSYTPVVRY